MAWDSAMLAARLTYLAIERREVKRNDEPERNDEKGATTAKPIAVIAKWLGLVWCQSTR